MQRNLLRATTRAWRITPILLLGLLFWAPPALAGGQGTSLPPVPLPVRQTELQIVREAPMVCVDAPSVACEAPYLDASSAALNDAGGTFRSTGCPGSGACRPDYIVGAELTGELLVDWPITRTPPDPDPGIEPGLSCGAPPWYKFCHSGHIQLNVTAPGVSVANPIYEYVKTGSCDCFDNPRDEQAVSSQSIDGQKYWVPRNFGASCDVAVAYSSTIPREKLVAIGQQAFPSLLCDADVNGVCSIEPVPVLVEPDGSLTRGCGSPPSGTFQIRFARSNQPLTFVRKPLLDRPSDAADLTGDEAAELISWGTTDVGVNNGGNHFTPQPSGVGGFGLGGARIADWTGDGDPDLVRPSGGTRIYPGNGDATFDEPGSFLAGGASGSMVEVSDLNADVLPDAVSSSTTASQVVWNQTDGPISPGEESVGMATQAVVDLDSDGDADLLGLQAGSPVPIDWAANSGPGSFSVQNVVSIAQETDALVPLLGQELVDVLECDPYASSCCSTHGGLGCDDSACEDLVCNQLGSSGCCNFGWDEDCRDIALERCGACMAPATPDCCSGHGGVGCEIQSCQDVVCERYSSCCSSGWDEDCASDARGYCNECHAYNVLCRATVVDVDAADVDGDGDADLCVALHVDMTLLHPNQDRDAEAGYLACLPNLQVDDPQSSSGLPLFDPSTDPWNVVGPTPVQSGGGASGQFELTDFDGDGDPDAVGVGYWYENQSGRLVGPHQLGIGSPASGCGVDGLFGIWRLNGNANDSTGCGNDGSVSGAMLVPDVDGSAGSAYAFDGVDDFISLGTSQELKPALPLTISMWVRHSCPPATVCDLLHNDVALGIFSGVRLYIDSTGALGARYGDGGGSSSSDLRRASAVTLLTPGAWHHVALVINGPTDFDFYIDGVLDGVTYSGAGAALAYTGADASLAGGAYGQPYSGDLDEIRLYDRALSQAEIQALPAPGDPIPAGLLDPEENLQLDTLFVRDVDGDGDADALAAEVMWERVPEPGLLVLLGSGLIGLRALVHLRERRRQR